MTRDETHAYPQPDRRYWRRRVNRHVRKARRTRALLRMAGILIANVALGILLFVAGAGVVRHFTSSRELAVRDIVVEGTTRTTPDSVRAVLREFIGENLLEVSLQDVASEATKHPWVKQASVKRLLPGTLRVSIVERAPAALARIRGGVQVVDEAGTLMGPVGPAMPFDLPVVTGLDGRQGPALASALANAVRVLLELRRTHPAWCAGVSELDVTLPDRVAVTRNTGGPTILLDPGRVGRNLDEFIHLQPMIARRLGDVTRVDLRWDSRIALLPGGDAPLSESE